VTLLPMLTKFEVTGLNLPSLLGPHMLCEAGTILCSILSDGTVVPCTHLSGPEWHAGNLRMTGFVDIWANSHVLQRLRPVGSLKKRCVSCSLVKTCKGGCRFRAYVETGDIGAIDPLCPFEKGEI